MNDEGGGSDIFIGDHYIHSWAKRIKASIYRDKKESNIYKNPRVPSIV